VIVVAMGLGWWLDRVSMMEMQKLNAQLKARNQFAELELMHERKSYAVLAIELQKRGIHLPPPELDIGSGDSGE
jgi:hypothetical protein